MAGYQDLHKEDKGSVTVEASLGIFIFLMFFLSVIYYFQVIDLQLKVQSALEETVRLQAAAYIVGQVDQKEINTLGCDISKAFASADMIRRLKPDYLEHSWIRNGCMGISLARSSILADGETISLIARYTIKIPLFPGLDFQVEQAATRRIWIGDDSSRLNADHEGASDEGESVYATSDGVAYHLYKDCTYLEVKLKAVDIVDLEHLRSKDGSIYYPCEVCKPPKSGLGYIAAYGNRYHSSEHCRAIERHVESISMDDLGGRHICSKCKKRAGKEVA